MRHRFTFLIAGLAFLAAACSRDATGPEPAATATDNPAVLRFGHDRGLVVMSLNMYVGADVDAIIGALATPDPADDAAILIQQAGVLGETDFPTRAAGLADLVARERPHVIGLMEISKIDLELPPAGISYHVDFLAEITKAFRARHLHYRVAAKERNFVAAPTPGVSLEDYDVMLVDARRVAVGREIIARTFTVNLGLVAPGVTLARGFVSVPINVGEERYRVTSTHTEADLAGNNLGLLRAAQMQELVGAIGDARHAVVMGDLNDFVGSPMYQVLQAAGFTDVWAALQPGAEGFTCCHASNLTDARALNQRIDYIWTRGFQRHDAPVEGFIRRFNVGPDELLAGPVHPIYLSDHAGLIAYLDPPRRHHPHH